jgi:predicted RNA methylase
MSIRERQSHIFEKQMHEHYVEPQEVADAVIRELERSGLIVKRTTVLDPACGFGRIVRAAVARGHATTGVDIVPRWRNSPDGKLNKAVLIKANGLTFMRACQPGTFGAVISNPPFESAEEFVDAALHVAPIVAFILPATWDCGEKRSYWLDGTPLAYNMPIVPRPSMPPGEYLLAGNKPGGGRKDYALYVWKRGHVDKSSGGFIRWREP